MVFPPALEAAKHGRLKLQDTAALVEEATATPSSAPSWNKALSTTLQSLQYAFEAHINLTEGEDGLFAEVRAHAPRLEHSIHTLRQEHQKILESISFCSFLLKKRENTPTEITAKEIRESVTSLLSQISRHRQHGSDFTYEAYHVDIGGSGG